MTLSLLGHNSNCGGYSQGKQRLKSCIFRWLQLRKTDIDDDVDVFHNVITAMITSVTFLFEQCYSSSSPWAAFIQFYIVCDICNALVMFSNCKR